MGTSLSRVTIIGMKTQTGIPVGERELSSRTSDGIQVRLLWNPVNDGVRVAVLDTRLAQAFEFPVVGGDAMGAFQHPFAYAARCGLIDDNPVEFADVPSRADGVWR
jgi:hypothetical protein